MCLLNCFDSIMILVIVNIFNVYYDHVSNGNDIVISPQNLSSRVAKNTTVHIFAPRDFICKTFSFRYYLINFPAWIHYHKSSMLLTLHLYLSWSWTLGINIIIPLLSSNLIFILRVYIRHVINVSDLRELLATDLIVWWCNYLYRHY